MNAPEPSPIIDEVDTATLGRVRARPPGARPVLADGLIAALAATYVIWSAVPRWYTAEGRQVLGIPVPDFRFNAWGGLTRIAALLAIIAVAWVGVRLGRGKVGPVDAPVIDVALAGPASLLTAVGGVAGRPATTGTASASWGLWVGLALALAWLGAAGWRLRRARSEREVPIPGGGFTG